jgi:hypothetical protein
MKRLFVSSFLAVTLMVGAGSSVAELTAEAAQKSRSRQSRPARPRGADTNIEAYSSARDSDSTRPRTVNSNKQDSAAQDGGGIRAEIVGPVYVTYTVPENQYFRLRMNHSISSQTARPGDQVETTVVTPVYAGGVQVVPAGAIVYGRVTSVSRARSEGRAGHLGVSFNTLMLPDGKMQRIDGALIEIPDDGSAEIDNNEVSGRPSDSRRIIYIGGGGAGGAVLGGAIGGKKGAVIGAILGAGAGVAGSMIARGKEAVIRNGSEIGMETTQPLEISVIDERR